MISQKSQLEVKIQEKDHTYQCGPNCPLNECLDALNIFRSYIYGRIKEAEELEKEKCEKVEEPKPE